jgi:hypothetical protein
VGNPEATALLGAEALRERQQLLGHPPRHVGQDQIGQVVVGAAQPAGQRAMSSQPSSSAALAVIALRHPGHNVHHAQLDSGNRLEDT